MKKTALVSILNRMIHPTAPQGLRRVHDAHALVHEFSAAARAARHTPHRKR
jgi:hypothetical protein